MHDPIAHIRERAGEPQQGCMLLERFDAAYRAHTGQAYDWHRPTADLVVRLFGNSHALASRLIAHPAWAGELEADPFAVRRKPRDIMAAELTSKLTADDPTDAELVSRGLRRYKYREMIRIVARDLARCDSVDELLAEWTDLADILIDAAYRHERARLAQRFGESCAGCIIGLGKLGGGELNYSSDIDVIFIYECDDENSGDVQPHEFYTRLAKAVTRLLDDVTPEGFVFRVDHELRPEGIQGTLANSLDAAERYYESFGRDWERQALIRARPITGDAALGATFIERMRPFVYRRSLGFEDLKAMRRMKERMAQTVRRDAHADVKLGPGGIRSIEFLIQAFQLIYGGRINGLRTTNTFRAIDVLAREGLIHPASAARLRNAYAFLRRTENMLQIVREQQTYTIPANDASRGELAKRLGYEGEPSNAALAFDKDLARTIAGAERLAAGMFEQDYERIELTEAIEENLATCAGEEEVHDSIPWFKHQEVRRIQHLDLEGRLSLDQVLSRLTLVAEVVIATARRLATTALTARFGVPREEDGNPASFAVVGMGRLGSGEIDYGSDLDVCFVYSGDGRTDGSRCIENREFFTRLAQRIISLITISSRYGRAYEVDSDLRPSGQSGALVSTHQALIDYHLGTAEPWERTAMLRARVIDGDNPFAVQLGITIDNLAFDIAPPDAAQARAQLVRLRQRAADERSRDGGNIFDIKHARGGSSDLDMAIHYRQLMNVGTHPRLRTRNTFAAAAALYDEGLIKTAEYESMRASLDFYRKLTSRMRLLIGRAVDAFDVRWPQAATIAVHMGCPDTDSLIRNILATRRTVTALFDRTFADTPDEI